MNETRSPRGPAEDGITSAGGIECAPCISSPAPAAVCTQTSFLDTSPSSPSSGTPTPAPCSASEPPTAGFPACTCTKETFGCSIHPRGRAEWIACMRASLARMSASLETRLGSTANEAASTEKSSASLTFYDRDSCSWRTAQQSLVADSAEFSETWPRAGSMRAGSCWPLETWAHHTCESDGGCWPTPLASTNRRSRGSMTAKHWSAPGLEQAVELAEGILPREFRSASELNRSARRWATPTVKGNYNRKGASKKAGDGLAMQVGGCLNPTWVEWLMGWPLGATACTSWETARSRSPRRPRGGSSRVRSAAEASHEH